MRFGLFLQRISAPSMSTLSKKLREDLATVTKAAREAAESACRAALENLAVHEKDFRGHMTVEQRKLRNQLRARGRALGDVRDERSGSQDIQHLVEAAAYEHWHRLLFTRFLADNHLLRSDAENGDVPVTLPECEELALELNARDGFDLACRFAAKTLPGVFRSDDPVLQLRLALNDEVDLRRLLDSLPHEVFIAADSLGWTYQFWQEKRKVDVNKSGKKIGADEISAVTQLFTEDYMVEFLLHNTLGAWWAGKLGPIQATDEEEARAKAALQVKDGLGITWTYLRFIQDEKTKTWSPAAGGFKGWPKLAKLIRVLDPCMGSGHFVVFALPLLARLRMEEENLSAAQAIHATLRDNLFNLELDERCAQIAAFNLALTAWKLGGYQTLPPLHLACSGLAPRSAEKDWVALAGDNDRLKRGMSRLYSLFKDAPILGSLINPRAMGGDLVEADFQELQPLLEKALGQEINDDTAHEMAVTARGLAKAAEILAGQFTLVATNVPYLGQAKQNEVLQEFAERTHPEAKADLATCFVERCIEFCSDGGVTSLVTPQNWLFLGSYKSLRRRLLGTRRWVSVGRLGSGAFGTISGEVVNVSLVAISKETPLNSSIIFGIDVSSEESPFEKASGLATFKPLGIKQSDQIHNPDSAVVLGQIPRLPALSQIADVNYGSKPGQTARVTRSFWELGVVDQKYWRFMESSPEAGAIYSGKAEVCLSQSEIEYQSIVEFGIRGSSAWGKRGVIFAKMSRLSSAIYVGEFYDDNTYTIIPKRSTDVAALFVYVSSAVFYEDLRRINQKLNVTRELVEQLPFDLAHWQAVSAEKYPNGLPIPYSSDPTQWLFNGHPADADQPLHVAVARLLGYQWPRQTGSSFPDCPALGPDGLERLADEDGIVCLPPLNREQPAANRLRELLAKALGKFDERALLAGAGSKGSKSTTLEVWLRDEFFEQHCDLFHQRPFIWHFWDGHKDGFHALVNYHKLDHANLQKLTYSYLGDWIRQQEEDSANQKPGADSRLGAARALQVELAKIQEGEAPYDIFVRWKPLARQALGWHPDINDGVRMNIRPFMNTTDLGKKGAGILRAKPGVKWEKDRGKEPHRDKTEYPWFWCGEEPGTDPVGGKAYPDKDNRWNNVHLTLAAKKNAINR